MQIRSSLVPWKVALLVALLAVLWAPRCTPCRAEEARPDLQRLRKHKADLEARLTQARARRDSLEQELRGIDELVHTNAELTKQLRGLVERHPQSRYALKASGRPALRGGAAR